MAPPHVRFSGRCDEFPDFSDDSFRRFLEEIRFNAETFVRNVDMTLSDERLPDRRRGAIDFIFHLDCARCLKACESVSRRYYRSFVLMGVARCRRNEEEKSRLHSHQEPLHEVSVVETSAGPPHPRSEIPSRKVVTSTSSRWPNASSRSAISVSVEEFVPSTPHPRVRWRRSAASANRWRS